MGSSVELLPLRRSGPFQHTMAPSASTQTSQGGPSEGPAGGHGFYPDPGACDCETGVCLSGWLPLGVCAVLALHGSVFVSTTPLCIHSSYTTTITSYLPNRSNKCCRLVSPSPISQAWREVHLHNITIQGFISGFGVAAKPVGTLGVKRGHKHCSSWRGHSSQAGAGRWDGTRDCLTIHSHAYFQVTAI